MSIHASGEDYLEAVLVLHREKGAVRSIDLARHLGFSKPSVSHAVGVLRSGGFLEMDQDGLLHLTELGREVAEQIYDRHCYFQNLLLSSGVEPEKAEQEACRMEHAISTESYRRLRAMLEGGLTPEERRTEPDIF
ncbi:MAG: metal-dependent transcriptional regulator [Oscillospiraceae bacterium]|nr:metal-dependent transcriptional regulator [Oscillospiraceae bacterium]